MTAREQSTPGLANGAPLPINREKSMLLTAKANKTAYWSATILLVLGMLAGGLEQLLHTRRMVDLMVHLGYPTYLLYILGVWQILGAIAILAPGFGLLKEWAYAGLFILYTSAAASHLLVRDGMDLWIVPLLLALIAMISWKLRPDSRKIQHAKSEPRPYRTRQAILYWTATGLIALILISGGLWLLSTSQFMVDGFPPYFWKILAVWKIVGGLVILIPRFPIAKEWAYAGAVFNMTGATAARVSMSDSTAHILVPLLLCGVAIASWRLRPASRRLNRA